MMVSGSVDGIAAAFSAPNGVKLLAQVIFYVSFKNCTGTSTNQ
jgi:hypothetical protein